MLVFRLSGVAIGMEQNRQGRKQKTLWLPKLLLSPLDLNAHRFIYTPLIFGGTQQAASNQEGEGKILKSTMSIIGFVDWRGNPISRWVHGGVRAAWFIYCKVSIYMLFLVASTFPDMFPGWKFLIFKLRFLHFFSSLQFWQLRQTS